MRLRSGRAQQARDEAEIDMTPMLDVVFILLIFFLIATSFGKEWAISLDKAGRGAQASGKGENIRIQIVNDQTISVRGRELSLLSIKSHIQQFLAKYPEGTVMVQASNSTHSNALIKVVDTIRQAGTAKIVVDKYQ